MVVITGAAAEWSEQVPESLDAAPAVSIQTGSADLASRASISVRQSTDEPEVLRFDDEVVTRHVDANTSSAAELETLPGIGPALAARIIAHRPYSGPEDLERVPGIGPATRSRIAPLLTWHPAVEADGP